MKRGKAKYVIIKTVCVIAVIAILVAVIAKYLLVGHNVSQLIEYLRSFGPATYLVFFALYIALASLSFPTTPLNITAGILFMYPVAVGIALIAGNIAAVISFLLARYFAQDAVKRYLSHMKNAENILELVKQEGFKLVFLVRLNPFIPASVKNFGFGVTAISLKKYVLATLLGQIPLVMIYTYLGYVGGAAMMDKNSRPEDTHLMLLGGGLIVSVVLLIVIGFFGKRWLNRRTPNTANNAT